LSSGKITRFSNKNAGRVHGLAQKNNLPPHLNSSTQMNDCSFSPVRLDLFSYGLVVCVISGIKLDSYTIFKKHWVLDSHST
jgi:hypothetical protein